jgi:DNA modification methylase
MNLKEWLDKGKPVNSIVNCDCLEGMKHIDNVDLIVTDPPYLYENGGTGNTCLKSIKKIKEGLKDIENDFDIYSWFEKIKKIMKKINIFIFCSNKQISRTMNLFETNNLITTLLTWEKVNCTPFCNGVWRPDLEYIVHAREKGAYFKGNAELKRKCFRSPYVRSKWGHPTEKPIDLIHKYILIGSKKEDVILDSFAGSGTTAISAIRTGRNYILFEKEKKYCDIAKERIEIEQMQLKLFC